MAIFNIYSKRQKLQRGEVPDVYQYDELPNSFRVQVVHILRDLLGDPLQSYSPTQEWFKGIHDILCREYGLLGLRGQDNSHDPQTDVFNFFLKAINTEQALDVIELSVRYGEHVHGGDRNLEFANTRMKPDAAIEELNARFREQGIGFQFESGSIVRVDSQVLHAEAVKPALYLLSERRFSAANQEFLKAHGHYRAGEYGDTLNECLKSFESTLKVICKHQRWPFKETDTAKTLLDAVFKNGLVPEYLQGKFAGLRSVLEGAIPTARSRESAHGAGEAPKRVPRHLASYVLHLTASSVLFLVEAEKVLP